MKILPVSRNSSKNFKYHKKDITANQYNTNPLKEIYFTSLISNSDLIKMGFKPANIQNNKIIIDFATNILYNKINNKSIERTVFFYESWSTDLFGPRYQRKI